MLSESPIWRIKYLPKTLNEICGRNDIKERLQNLINDRNFPHLLFVGSKGIGKTTIADLFSKEFLGRFYDVNSKVVYANVPLTNEETKQARLEAYVSTNKIGSLAGKKITTPAFIRVKIKPFVQLKVLGDAPFKILIVKDFDSLGSNQQAFRRLMEIYGTNCRMILITTKVSKIIDPIMSRCQVFLISQIDFQSFEELISTIAEKEALKIDKETIRTLYEITAGKLSNAIDLLQICSISGNDIDVDKLYENFSNSKNDMIKSLLIMCFKGDFRKARELSRKIQSSYKFTSQEMFQIMLNELAKLPFSTYSRMKLINLLAEADFRAIDGRDTDIQISNLLAKICQFSEVL
ncbi:MAG TPA: AAA family ATPase [Candidatus Nanopelagicaceae bacterium]|nr:AAA family ATPase [Candidatus Nanopelagicaceae bacterium]